MTRSSKTALAASERSLAETRASMQKQMEASRAEMEATLARLQKLSGEAGTASPTRSGPASTTKRTWKRSPQRAAGPAG